MAASVNWNKRVLVIESEAVRREAVGCIAGLDGSCEKDADGDSDEEQTEENSICNPEYAKEISHARELGIIPV